AGSTPLERTLHVNWPGDAAQVRERAAVSALSLLRAALAGPPAPAATPAATPADSRTSSQTDSQTSTPDSAQRPEERTA
uniref:hypothetical protein n=1 Tax=Deinococcus sp. TaxID=47478 RepID=UPI0025C3B05E